MFAFYLGAFQNLYFINVTEVKEETSPSTFTGYFFSPFKYQTLRGSSSLHENIKR